MDVIECRKILNMTELYTMTNYDMLKLNTKHGQCKWSLTDLWELLITDNKTTRAECGV